MLNVKTKMIEVLDGKFFIELLHKSVSQQVVVTIDESAEQLSAHLVP